MTCRTMSVAAPPKRTMSATRPAVRTMSAAATPVRTMSVDDCHVDSALVLLGLTHNGVAVTHNTTYLRHTFSNGATQV